MRGPFRLGSRSLWPGALRYACFALLFAALFGLVGAVVNAFVQPDPDAGRMGVPNLAWVGGLLGLALAYLRLPR